MMEIIEEDVEISQRAIANSIICLCILLTNSQAGVVDGGCSNSYCNYSWVDYYTCIVDHHTLHKCTKLGMQLRLLYMYTPLMKVGAGTKWK